MQTTREHIQTSRLIHGSLYSGKYLVYIVVQQVSPHTGGNQLFTTFLKSEEKLKKKIDFLIFPKKFIFISSNITKLMKMELHLMIKSRYILIYLKTNLKLSYIDVWASILLLYIHMCAGSCFMCKKRCCVFLSSMYPYQPACYASSTMIRGRKYHGCSRKWHLMYTRKTRYNQSPYFYCYVSCT
jgi:hypothetical protein